MTFYNSHLLSKDLDPERQMGFCFMERWVDIIGFENYQVSDNGRLRRKNCKVPYKSGSIANYSEKILKPDLVKGYLRYTLSKENVQKRYVIHRLVALYFIPNQLNKPCVNHKDGNKLNNHYTNLEWVTHSENERHSYDVLKKVNSNRKLSMEQANDVRNNCTKGIHGNVSHYCNKYGVCRKVIHNILDGKYYINT